MYAVLFVGAVILAAAWCNAAPADAPAAKVSFVEGDKKIDVMIDGKLFTSYLFDEKLTKPVLYPLIAPSGVKVSRGFPFEKVEGEATDHPHHIGIFLTYDEVNGEGFWNNTTSPPQVQHVKVTKMEPGNGKGELCTVMNWAGKDGVLLEEKRKMVFSAGPGQYEIDFSIDLTARDKKVVFGDTKEGMFAIRTAQWLREKDGTGRYLSSEGGKTSADIWGTRARWVTLEGKKDDKTIGIAILNYAPSANYPTFWHVRDYGLFSANPLGQLAFEKGRKVADAKAFGLTLEPGQTAHLNFHVVIYEGPRSAEQLDALFAKYPK
jgi:hypothetical protein